MRTNTKAYHYALFNNERFVPSRYLVGIDDPSISGIPKMENLPQIIKQKVDASRKVFQESIRLNAKKEQSVAKMATTVTWTFKVILFEERQFTEFLDLAIRTIQG